MAIAIIHELRRAQGRNKKELILRRHSNNEYWKRYLQYVYDDSINYYVSAPFDTTFKDIIDMDDMFTFLDELSSGEYTGNTLRNMAKQASKNYGELFRLALGRSIKAGISITTLNKIYPDLIPTFDVMLAKDVPIEEYPVVISTKYDGVRLVAFVNEVQAWITRIEVTLRTRSGKVVQIDSLLEDMSKCKPGVYDGELVASTGLQENRTKITGHVNKCLKGSSTDITNYTFYVFDYLTSEEWMNRHSSMFGLRQEALKKNLQETMRLKVAPQYLVNSPSMVQHFFEDRIQKGYEGIMARYETDPYLWKRSDKLVKKKATKTCTLQCVGINSGTGKYEGMIGALICTGKVEGKYIKVKVGSGLSDYDRELDPRYYIDRAVEVLYNDIVTSDNVIFSLFLPRYKRMLGTSDV